MHLVVTMRKKCNFLPRILCRQKKIESPFSIDKTGFGNACAWMVVNDIKDVMVK